MQKGLKMTYKKGGGIAILFLSKSGCRFDAIFVRSASKRSQGPGLLATMRRPSVLRMPTNCGPLRGGAEHWCSEIAQKPLGGRFDALS
jgi:hypothetical protein